MGNTATSSQNNTKATIIARETWVDDSPSGWSTTDANITTPTVQGANTISVTSTAAPGYAYKEYDCEAGTIYLVRLKVASSQIGAGVAYLKIGTSANNTTNLNTSMAVTGVYNDLYIVTGSSQTSLFVTLWVQNSMKSVNWSDLLIEQYDV